MHPERRRRVTLEDLRRMKAAGEKFAMLTAYDYPTAAAAEAAGVHSLLIGDSLACVVLGHENTRGVSLELMIELGKAVRAGAPHVYFVGDVPFKAMQAGDEGVLSAAERFTREAGCDAVKFEADRSHEKLVEELARRHVETIVHLGLRPQQIESPDGYRAQARDVDAIEQLVRDVKLLVDAGAAMVLLEAVPNEASQAVAAAVDVPLIGCGAGPACDGHVVVTHDMLGIGAIRPPRFVPVLAQVGRVTQEAMRQYVTMIVEGRYPAAEHVYPMRRQAADTPARG